MLEHAIYSVISPEPGAAILFRDAARAEDMAMAQKITAEDLLGFEVIDGIIPEPMGGAHRNHEPVLEETGKNIATFLSDFEGKTREEIRDQRQQKFLSIGKSLS
jgi:acetyl-CoA carboxylase carboxyl transferase subunit alpha